MRATLDRLAGATARHDYAALCGAVFTRSLIDTLTQRGLPCEQVLRAGLANVRNPHLTIGKITVRGGTATAVVHSTADRETPATDVVQLVKQGNQWRVAQLATPQPVQNPAGPTASSGPSP